MSTTPLFIRTLNTLPKASPRASYKRILLFLKTLLIVFRLCMIDPGFRHYGTGAQHGKMLDLRLMKISLRGVFPLSSPSVGL